MTMTILIGSAAAGAATAAANPSTPSPSAKPLIDVLPDFLCGLIRSSRLRVVMVFQRRRKLARRNRRSTGGRGEATRRTAPPAYDRLNARPANREEIVSHGIRRSSDIRRRRDGGGRARRTDRGGIGSDVAQRKPT